MSIQVRLRGNDRQNPGKRTFLPRADAACWDTRGQLGPALGGVSPVLLHAGKGSLPDEGSGSGGSRLSWQRGSPSRGSYI